MPSVQKHVIGPLPTPDDTFHILIYLSLQYILIFFGRTSHLPLSPTCPATGHPSTFFCLGFLIKTVYVFMLTMRATYLSTPSLCFLAVFVFCQHSDLLISSWRHTLLSGLHLKIKHPPQTPPQTLSSRLLTSQAESDGHQTTPVTTCRSTAPLPAAIHITKSVTTICGSPFGPVPFARLPFLCRYTGLRCKVTFGPKNIGPRRAESRVLGP